MNDELKDLMAELAQTQRAAIRAAGEHGALSRAIAESELGQQLEATGMVWRAQEERLKVLRAQIQEVAAMHYAATGDKKPAPGLTIKMFEVLDYDLGEALAWCEQNAPTVIKRTLDARAFEKVAVALGAPVQAREAARISVASDLSMYEDTVTP